MNNISCPHCSMSIMNDGTMVHQNVACPHCAGQFLMPAQEFLWFFCDYSGAVHGPVSKELLHNHIRLGNIPPNCMIRREDVQVWENYCNTPQNDIINNSNPLIGHNDSLFGNFEIQQSFIDTGTYNSPILTHTSTAPVKQSAGCLILIVALLLLLFFGSKIFESKPNKDENMPVKKSLNSTYTAMTVVLLTISVTMILGLSWACPKCQGLWAQVIQKVDHLGTSHGTKTVTRKDQHYNAPVNINNPAGMTIRQEQVLVIKTTNRNHCKCRWCGHKWNYISVQES